jgi:hypothetical protein
LHLAKPDLETGAGKMLLPHAMPWIKNWHKKTGIGKSALKKNKT